MDPKSRHFFFISPSKLFLPRTYTAAEGLPRRKMKKNPILCGAAECIFYSPRPAQADPIFPLFIWTFKRRPLFCNIKATSLCMSDDDEGARYTLIRALKYHQIVLDRQILSFRHTYEKSCSIALRRRSRPPILLGARVTLTCCPQITHTRPLLCRSTVKCIILHPELRCRPFVRAGWEYIFEKTLRRKKSSTHNGRILVN
jgi:hypothetical protein